MRCRVVWPFQGYLSLGGGGEHPARLKSSYFFAGGYGAFECCLRGEILGRIHSLPSYLVVVVDPCRI